MAEQKACVNGVHFSFLPPNAPLTWLATTHHQTARPPSPSLPSAHWAHLAVVHSAAVTLHGSILDGGGRRETDGTRFWYFSADCFHSPLSKNNTHFKTLSELGENKILIIKIFIFGTNVLQEERLQFSCTRPSLLPSSAPGNEATQDYAALSQQSSRGHLPTASPFLWCPLSKTGLRKLAGAHPLRPWRSSTYHHPEI